VDFSNDILKSKVKLESVFHVKWGLKRHFSSTENVFVPLVSEFCEGVEVESFALQLHIGLLYRFLMMDEDSLAWRVSRVMTGGENWSRSKRLPVPPVDSSPWWWRQYAPPKRRSTTTILHGAISQKVIIFLSSLSTDSVTEIELRSYSTGCVA
jgi:hypothetical protein